MIEKWKIVEKKNEQVLYLYLNTNYEFSHEFFHNEKFKDEIDKFIKKIHFDGHKIYIMSASLALATILLTNNPKELENDYKYISKNTLDPIINTSIKLEDKDINEKEKSEILKQKDSIKQEEVKKSTSSKKSTSKTTQKSSSSKKSTSNSSSSKNKTTTQKKSSTSSSKTSSKKPSTSSTQKPNTNTQNNKKETIVTVYRSNGKVEKIELEEYLIGVVAGEMPASFSSEALKAQAVVARTYTLKAIKTGKKLTDTVATQVYNDKNQLKKKWGSSYNTYYNKIKNAVNATKGLTVKYNGDYIEALYHSTSNGYTEDSGNVFINSFPYLQSVESPWDKNVSSYQKTITLNYQETLKKLGITQKDAKIEILERNRSQRVSKIRVGDKEYTGAKFRTLLSLRSADFDIEQTGNTLKITTKGFGHGVGMSQYGANEMAKQGKTYQQIIKHYYKGVTISK